MKTMLIQTIIITSMEGLCNFMRKDNIEILNIIPTKGIDNEDVVKVEYRYKKAEEEL